MGTPSLMHTSLASSSSFLAVSCISSGSRRRWVHTKSGGSISSSSSRRRRLYERSSSHFAVDAALDVDTSGSLSRAKMGARRTEQVELEELNKPLAAYMSLPASQYSVLDAERIERVDDNTFKCYAHRLSFMGFEVCPMLLVQVDEMPQGCCIKLLGCTLDGSPIVKESNNRFSASMENNVSWSVDDKDPEKARLLKSDTCIEVSVEIPPPFQVIPKNVIESAGSQVLMQLLRVALPRFLTQLKKDYTAWATGDTSRKPLGTGQI